jgi:uncharacterized tellurite resistance protein B-like protein/GTPase SAR1 family protein
MVALASRSTNLASIAALLSRLTAQDIEPAQASKLLVFVGALSTILLGVTVADQQISADEKTRLQAILNEFVPTSSPLRSLFELMFKGVKQHKLFNQPDELAILTNDLSDSEMLLLLALGYELAAADGTIDPTEEDYLVGLAQGAGLDVALTGAIRDGLTEAATIDGDALAEVRHLLDPARFQSLDPVFSRAAERLLTHFPPIERAITAPKSIIHYDGLAKFQAQRQHLQGVCAELGNLLAEGSDRLSLPSSLTTDLTKVWTRLASQTFRVAIVGEFSQGKSTLLNALLGEELQPVRAIPCSGTVTVLRHGGQRRVIARYRDGREEEIPFEQYQEKAAISEDAALSNRDDALNSDLLELVLEHPGLALCQQGVELVDSPGLNEHPDRTRLTHQLLENVDAVIFLANASRPLTQGERELLQELRLRLNGGDASRPAESLFVVVNFMDLLRREKDQQQVKQLFEHFLLGEDAVLSGSDRLHFISAQAALDAMLDGKTEDDFLQGIRHLIREIESHLVNNKNNIRYQQSRRGVESVINQLSDRLKNYYRLLDRKIALSADCKQHIIELMGEGVSQLGKLSEVIKQAQAETDKSIDAPLEIFFNQTLREKITLKSDSWSLESEHDRNKILKSFHHKFQADTSAILEEWIEVEIFQGCMATFLTSLDSKIYGLAQNLQRNIESIDQETGAQFSQQFTLSLQRSLPNFQINSQAKSDDGQFWSTGIGGGIGLGAGGLLAGGVAIAVSSVAFFPVVLTGAAITGIAVAGAAVGTSIGTALGFFSAPNQEEIRKEVLQDGLKTFNKATQEKLEESIQQFIRESFEQRHLAVDDVINGYLETLNSVLMEHEKSEKSTVNQVDSEQAWGATLHSRLQVLTDRLN